MSARQRAEIPPATDELLAAGQRKVGEGRLNLRALKPAGIDDAETERHVEEITHSYGAHAQIAPKKDQVSEPRNMQRRRQARPGRPSRRTRYASFRSGFARISRSGADRAVSPRPGDQNFPDYAGLAPRRIHREPRGFGGRPAQNPLPSGLVSLTGREIASSGVTVRATLKRVVLGGTGHERGPAGTVRGLCRGAGRGDWACGSGRAVA